MWIYAMDLYFKVEKQILQGLRAFREAFNLVANIAIWFKANKIDIDALT